MKKLLIILVIFASCKKEPIEPTQPTNPTITGIWSRSFDGYSERYRFAEIDGSYLLQNDSNPAERVHYDFDFIASDSEIILEYWDETDTLNYCFTGDTLVIDGNKFVN